MSDTLYLVWKSELDAVAGILKEKSGVTEQLAFPNGFVSVAQDMGGAELNFEVIGGTVQPENPKENTIWIETDQEITNWWFSGLEPDEPVEGMVWIKTGSNSPIPLNALKDETIMVRIAGCEQYKDGAYITRTISAYQNGEWKNTDFYAYSYGDQNEELTGGWTVSKTGTNGSFEVQNNRVYMCHAKMTTNYAIDMTPYKTMTMRLNLATRHENGVGFQQCGLMDKSGSMITVQHPNTLGDFTITFDISAINQECYINVQTGGSTYCSGYVYEVVLLA